MDCRAAQVPELAAARTERASPFVVVQVRVHRLRWARQPCGDGGVHDPAARPVEPCLERTRLRSQVGLPERDAGDAGRRRDLVCRLHARRGLDQAVDRQADRRNVLRRGYLRHVDTCDRQVQMRLQVVVIPGVDAHVDRLVARLSQQRGEVRPAPSLRSGRDRVLEVDDHRVRAGGDRLLHPVGRSPGTYSHVSGGTFIRHPRRVAGQARRG